MKMSEEDIIEEIRKVRERVEQKLDEIDKQINEALKRLKGKKGRVIPI